MHFSSGIFNLVPKPIRVGTDPLTDVVNSGEQTAFVIEVLNLKGPAVVSPSSILYEVSVHLS